MSPNILEKTTRLLNILITLLIVTACGSSTHYIQVTDKPPPPSKKIRHHLVTQGETLYSIAWRHSLDYKKLAHANGIYGDYRIYPGQILLLKESVTQANFSQANQTKPVKETASSNTAQTSRSIKETPVKPNRSTKTSSSDPRSWVWPANGRLIATFNSNNGLNKGIDIKGKLEDAVFAAAAGTVVYAGDGLRGYGKLIIVKHSEKYLSAYAHNHKLLVNEGALVKQGQRIASMGASGADTVKLHFEIRDDGKPVDPLKYLPRR